MTKTFVFQFDLLYDNCNAIPFIGIQYIAKLLIYTNRACHKRVNFRIDRIMSADLCHLKKIKPVLRYICTVDTHTIKLITITLKQMYT